ncbi:MAG: amino acid permease [Pirellulales bacterium]
MIDDRPPITSHQARPPHDAASGVAPRLGLWDAVSIIIGIVIGTSIFRTSPMVFQNAFTPGWALTLWVVGGAVSWCGAVCYAELATTYPRDGGDYVYLSRAFGRPCGFLFAWAQLTVIISGNIGAMAYAFADYGLVIYPQWKEHALWLTLAPVFVLTGINLMGIVAGKSVQNVFSLLKVLGLAAIAAAGLWAGARPPAEAAVATNRAAPDIGVALVFVLYAYGGWIHAPYVAAEIRDQRRNLPRALILAIAAITAIYVAVNAAYLNVLGFEGARQTTSPAADVLEYAAGPWGGKAVSLIVMLSALAAINAMILTGARVYAVWGQDYPALGWLGTWGRRGGPTAAILLQSAIAVALILLVGTQAGRDGFDEAISLLGLDGLPWPRFVHGFEALVVGVSPVYWGLCLLGGVAVFVLRIKDRGAMRPYTIPFYPLPALVLCASCAYLLYASCAYAGLLTLVGVVPLAVGGVVWLFVRRDAER